MSLVDDLSQKYADAPVDETEISDISDIYARYGEQAQPEPETTTDISDLYEKYGSEQTPDQTYSQPAPPIDDLYAKYGDEKQVESTTDISDLYTKYAQTPPPPQRPWSPALKPPVVKDVKGALGVPLSDQVAPQEDSRSFLDKAKNVWSKSKKAIGRGHDVWDASIDTGRALAGSVDGDGVPEVIQDITAPLADLASNKMTDKDIERIRPYIERQDALEREAGADPITSTNKITKAVYGAAETIGGMWGTMTDAWDEALVGAGIGLLGGGAGVLTGAKKGWDFGRAKEIYFLAAGQMYRDRVKDGIDPTIAKNTSMLAAVPYAATEFLFDPFSGGLSRYAGIKFTKAMSKGSVGKAMLSIGKQAAINWGLMVAKETPEEGIQQVIDDMSSNVASYFDNIKTGGNRKAKDAKEIMKNGMTAMVQAVGPIMVLGLGGVAGQSFGATARLHQIKANQTSANQQFEVLSKDFGEENVTRVDERTIDVTLPNGKQLRMAFEDDVSDYVNQNPQEFIDNVEGQGKNGRFAVEKALAESDGDVTEAAHILNDQDEWTMNGVFKPNAVITDEAGNEVSIDGYIGLENGWSSKGAAAHEVWHAVKEIAGITETEQEQLDNLFRGEGVAQQDEFEAYAFEKHTNQNPVFKRIDSAMKKLFSGNKQAKESEFETISRIKEQALGRLKAEGAVKENFDNISAQEKQVIDKAAKTGVPPKQVSGAKIAQVEAVAEPVAEPQDLTALSYPELQAKAKESGAEGVKKGSAKADIIKAIRKAEKTKVATKVGTSITKAATAEIRAELGRPPKAKGETRGMDKIAVDAQARIAENPKAGTELVNTIIAKPDTATTDTDKFVLVNELKTRRDRLRTAMESDVNAKTGSEKNAATTELILANELMDEMLYVAEESGTVSGRALRAMQAIIRDDWSIQNLKLQRKKQNKGKELTAKQLAQTEKIQKNVDKAQKKQDDKFVEEVLAGAKTEVKTSKKKGKGGYRSKITPIEHTRRTAEAEAGLIEKKDVVSRRSKPVKADTVLDAFREEFKKIRTPKKGEFQYREIVGSQGFQGDGVIPSNRLSPDADLSWEDALRRAKELNLVSEDASLPEDLTPLFTGTIKPLSSIESDFERRDIEEGRRLAAEEAFDKSEFDLQFSAGQDNLPSTSTVLSFAKWFIADDLDNKRTSGLGNVINRVHAELTAYGFPEITKQNVWELIYDYGKEQKPKDTKNDLDAKLAEVVSESGMLSKLVDALHKIVPKKRGGRGKPSLKMRTMLRQLNFMLKANGLDTRTHEERVATAMDTAKTKLTNEIEDLEKSIKNKTAIPVAKRGATYDKEYNDLKAQRDGMQNTLDAITGFKPGMTDEQRIRGAENAIDATLVSLKKQMKRAEKGDFSPDGKPKSSAWTAELSKKRQQAQELRDALKDMKKEANKSPYSDEFLALEKFIKQKEKLAQTYRDRLANKDFVVKSREQIKLNEEGMRAALEVEKAKTEWQEALFQDKLDNMTAPERTVHETTNFFNALKSLVTSYDISGVGRQGGMFLLSHPILALKHMPMLARVTSSEFEDFKATKNLMSRKNWFKYKKYRVGVTSSSGTTAVSQKEEEYAFLKSYAGSAIEKIPGLKASQRAYVTYLSIIRADLFDMFEANLSKDGMPLTDKEYQTIANFVNDSTGRAGLGKYENASLAMATVFFSPRFVWSRFRILVGAAMWDASPRARKAIAKEYARFGMAMATIISLIVAAGGEGEDDPRSSAFGKIKIGKTYIDLLSGLQQPLVFMSRLATGERKTQLGTIRKERGETAAFGGGTLQTINQFFRSKLAPIPGAGLTMITGRDYIGDEQKAWEVLLELPQPLVFRDMAEAMRVEGVPAGVAFGLLAILGEGISTQEGKPEKMLRELKKNKIKVGAKATRQERRKRLGEALDSVRYGITQAKSDIKREFKDDKPKMYKELRALSKKEIERKRELKQMYLGM